MRVTFDTNSFDRVVRPQRYARALDHAAALMIHRALFGGEIRGFISETVVTLEGIKVDDRATVLGGSRLQSVIEPSHDLSRIEITQTLQQPDRALLHPKQAERLTAALDFGLRLLGAPRVGMPRVEWPGGNDPYQQETDEQLTRRLDRFYRIAEAMQQRGPGDTAARAIASSFGARPSPRAPWFAAFKAAKDIHEVRKVARAVAEWSDADSIAAHFGYDHDIFCTSDEGRSAGGSSVLGPENRRWLTNAFGIRFANLSELAGLLGHEAA